MSIHIVSAAYNIRLTTGKQMNRMNELISTEDKIPMTCRAFFSPSLDFQFFSFLLVAVDADAVHSELVADDTLPATTFSVWQDVYNTFICLNVFCCRELLRCFVHLCSKRAFIGFVLCCVLL